MNKKIMAAYFVVGMSVLIPMNMQANDTEEMIVKTALGAGAVYYVIKNIKVIKQLYNYKVAKDSRNQVEQVHVMDRLTQLGAGNGDYRNFPPSDYPNEHLILRSSLTVGLCTFMGWLFYDFFSSEQVR